MEARDYLYNDNDDLLISNGDFVVGYSDEQHIKDIMCAAPGHFRQYPEIGANILQQTNGIINEDYKRIVRVNLENDGYIVKTVDFVEGRLIIEAERK
jgi:hypothetical protein